MPSMTDDDQQWKRELQDGVVVPALQFGAVTGSAGYVVGSTAALFRQSRPVMFGLAAGLQWFTLGATFSVGRSLLLRTSYLQPRAPETQLVASGIAGVFVGGAAGAVIRGPAKVLPAAVLFGGASVLGQFIHELATETMQKPEKEKPRTSILDSKWSPIRRISDEEFGNLLRDKLAQVDANIAALDAAIEELEEEKKNPHPWQSGSTEKLEPEKDR